MAGYQRCLPIECRVRTNPAQCVLPLLLLSVCCLAGATAGPLPVRYPSAPPVITYDSARYPHLQVVAGRLIAETDARLTAGERSALWRKYGLVPDFEWVRPASGADSGFTYHELHVRMWTPLDRARQTLGRLSAQVLRQPAPPALPARALPELIAQLSEDPRLHWVAPDALLLEWADGTPGDGGAGTVDDQTGGGKEDPTPPETAPAEPADSSSADDTAWSEAQAGPNAADSARAVANLPGSDPPLAGGYSAGLLSHEYKALGSVQAWEDAWNAAQAQSTDKAPLAIPGPLPEFEYYRLAGPDGTPVEWAGELAASDVFMQHCGKVYGTHQAMALEAYRAAGSPELAPVTVCIADTGVLRSHPELSVRMHPNALDCNYSSLALPAPDKLAGPGLEVVDREQDSAAGLPRVAIRSKPAGHGTNCAGVVMRCTDGFLASGGTPAVRLMPASLRSERAVAFVNGRLKTPISSFIRLVYALKENFPTGAYTPAPDATAQNTGDVRVVSVSASVPKSYFSDAEWKIVAGLAGKAAGAVAEDLRSNDRLYVFAAGNEAQAEPNKPADVDYVLSVSAAQACNGAQAWWLPQFKEGSNIGPECVSAPGEGIITSSIYPCPNLRYLPEAEFRSSGNWSVPNTGRQWHEQTNSFSATSSATPQVAALAALLYAQDSGRKHMEVIDLIRQSTGGRILTAPYGTSGGIVDYASALGGW
jgi:hypothetical protein